LFRMIGIINGLIPYYFLVLNTTEDFSTIL
jgi:hypothetical protein